MPTLDLSDFLADDALTLTGIVSTKHPDGKSYTIVSPSAKMGLRLQRVMQTWSATGPTTPPNAEQITELLGLVTDDGGNPIDFHVKLMGDTYQQMVDDGVSAEGLDRITSLVVTYYGTGSAMAKALVEAASEGKTEAPNRAARRSGAKAGQKSARASTGTATRTRRQGSTGSSTSPNARGGQAQAV